MELFYAHRCDGVTCFLDAEESSHCVRVLRHRAGDEIDVIDGLGTLYHCRLTDDNPKGAQAQVLSVVPAFGAHPYRLTIGCCPTKNNERFEWFVEKAVEIGIDRIVPLIGEHSERRVYKTERAQRIALSASKQSLKACIPEICEPMPVRDFLRADDNSLRLIAYCFENQEFPRRSITEVLSAYEGAEVTVLIGPEGDFSAEEAAEAVARGYIPVQLGPSRLRTETAAVTAAAAVYFRYL